MDARPARREDHARRPYGVRRRFHDHLAVCYVSVDPTILGEERKVTSDLADKIYQVLRSHLARNGNEALEALACVASFAIACCEERQEAEQYFLEVLKFETADSVAIVDGACAETSKSIQ
jgi:hypothetical protein